MGESTPTGLAIVWQKIATTVSENIDQFWTIAATAVGVLAVIWFCRLGLRLIKSMAESAS